MNPASANLVYNKAFWDGFTPEPRMTVSEWADRYRILSQKASAEPGRWSTARTPYLKEIMDCLSPVSPIEEVFLMKGAQVGGPLALETLVPTPDGWTTMGKIATGDRVFDERGRIQRVTGVSEVFHEETCYQVEFDDGTRVLCDWRHLWTVEKDNFKGTFKKITLKTQDLIQYLKKSNRNRYRIKVADPLDLPEVYLPIGPYTLGAWLGDGNRCSNRITTHEDDAPNMAKYIRQEGHRVDLKPASNSGRALDLVIDPSQNTQFCKRDHDLTILGKTKNNKCAQCSRDWSYYSQYGKRKPIPKKNFGALIRLIGVYRSKSIPLLYLRSSFDQRLSLLQGLMDTDGYCSKKGLCEFFTVDLSLAKQVQSLVCSLGLRARIVIKPASKNSTYGGTRPVCVVRFTAYRATPVFKLPRKLDRMKVSGRNNQTGYRRMRSITEIDSFPTRCISVSSKSHLFLVGNELIPTHNTECGNNWIGYVIDYAPGPMLAVQPTVDLAKRNSKLRIQPLIDECPRLIDKVKTARERDSGNTILTKDFPGGTLVMTGANSAVGLRSMPARYLFLDEEDGYPGDVDGEGDPSALARARTKTFARRKIFHVSTPTFAGRSRIEGGYDSSDRRKYFVPCPKCKEMQHLKWINIKYEVFKNSVSQNEPKDVHYICEHCSERIDEHAKGWMLANGEWRAEFPGVRSGKVAGFHINSLYSPLGWFSWHDAAQQWLDAQGKPEELRGFINTVLGESWKDKGDAPDWQKLYDRRETYETGSIPSREVVFITAGVDVQKDRLEIEIVGWGRDKQSWSIDFIVIPGDTSLSTTWKEVEKLVTATWKHEPTKLTLPLKMMAVDSGYNTQHVYNWVRRHPLNKVMAVKGMDQAALLLGAPTAVDITLAGKRIRRGVKVWPVGVSVAKGELYSWLKKENPIEGELFSPGYCHFPQYGDEYFKQLTSEQLVVKIIRGHRKYEWEKTRDRNEALDCRIYARAAASAIGMDRFTDEHWDELIGINGDSVTSQVEKNEENSQDEGLEAKDSERAPERESWFRKR